MSLNTAEFGIELKQLGFDFFSGVPCSFLNSLINYALNDCNYVMSANEGDAVATACGATMAGKKAVVLMQNSGLTNATSPITSLNYPFKLGILGFVSLRGEPGIHDEPQHELMGTITESMLDTMQVDWEYLDSNLEEAKLQLQKANHAISNDRTFFFVVKKGTFSSVELKQQQPNITTGRILQGKSRTDTFPKRLEILETINDTKGSDTVLLATTGKTGRELYEIEDAKNNFYMVGSMGCISSFGLGIALNTHKKVISIEGDGALLMRMGNLATNAYYAPANLLHIIIDNNIHDSTGGQFTVSGNMDLPQIASSCGYQHSIYIHSLGELQQAISHWKINQKTTFLYIKASKGTKQNLGRPAIKPYQVKERLLAFIND